MKEIILISLFGLVLSDMISNNIYEKQNPLSFYAGFGKSNSSNIEESSDTPWVIGLMAYAKGINAYVGLEFAGEGTMLSSTYGRDDAIERGDSFNLTISQALPIKIKDTSATLGVLIGSRDIREYCPSGDSYLGYACYADEDPEYDSEVNLGLLLSIRNKNTTIGYRYTQESSQIIFGYSVPYF